MGVYARFSPIICMVAIYKSSSEIGTNNTVYHPPFIAVCMPNRCVIPTTNHALNRVFSSPI